MPAYGTQKIRDEAARTLISAGLPNAKFVAKAWKPLAATFCHYSTDPEFADFICRGNIATTETLLTRLLKRQKSQKTHDAVARFMSYPHLFNRLSRAENEEKAFPLIEALGTSSQRGDVLAAHAWVRNVLRRRNGNLFTPQVISLLNSLDEKDLARAINSSQSHLSWTVKTYLSPENATKIFDRAGLEIK